MAHLDHNAAFVELKDRALLGIKSYFPMQGKLQSMALEGFQVHDKDAHSEDLAGQKEAKLKGLTWAVPVSATLALTDNKTGKVVDRRTIRVAELPRMTRRHSFIVDGQEYQVDNQWQLKPGAYIRRKQTGHLEAQFNVATRSPFKINFDPEKKTFMMERHKSSAIPLYPLLKVLGVGDDHLENTWGKEVLHANQHARGVEGAVDKFYRVDKKSAPASPEAAATYLTKTLQESLLRPDATRRTQALHARGR